MRLARLVKSLRRTIALTLLLTVFFQLVMQTVYPTLSQTAQAVAPAPTDNPSQTGSNLPTNPPTADANPAALATPPPPPKRGAYGRTQLSFEANQGQTDSRVNYLARGANYTVFLAPTEAVLSLKQTKNGGKLECPNDPNPNPAKGKTCSAASGRGVVGKADKGLALKLSLVGGNTNAVATGQQPDAATRNYLAGSDVSQWKLNVSSYNRISYANVYPKISLDWYGNQGQLQYDFTVAPGGDPNLIAFQVAGTDRLELTSSGELLIHNATDHLRQPKPLIYQIINNQMQPVSGSFTLKAANQFGFTVGQYDHTKPLVIDPILEYSTYIASSGYEHGLAIAVDSSGNSYITGYTSGTDFPTTTGAYTVTAKGNYDVFVSKLNPSGSALLYSTYLGAVVMIAVKRLR